MPEADPRNVRLVELREQLANLLSEFQGLETGSTEQLAALKRYEPIHTAVLALAEDLGA
jgi:Fe-S-cluster formation regulator IscX/YfhJ